MATYHGANLLTNLLIDTSGDTLVLAIFAKGSLLRSCFLPHGGNLSTHLLPEIEALLKNTPLSAIFVGVGPGSYTGVRIGVAAAECLSIALSIPLYPFCSLCAFLPHENEDGEFSYAFASKQNGAFLLEGLLEKGIITPPLKERKISLTECPPSTIYYDPKNQSPHLSPLLPYLETLKAAPAPKIEVIYLHNL